MLEIRKVLTGLDAYEALESEAIRPQYALLPGDVLTFPDVPQITIMPIRPGSERTFTIVRVQLNGRESWIWLKSVLGLGVIKENKVLYSSASEVNASLAKCFNLKEVYEHLAGNTYLIESRKEFTGPSFTSDGALDFEHPCKRSFPVLRRIVK